MEDDSSPGNTGTDDTGDTSVDDTSTIDDTAETGESGTPDDTAPTDDTGVVDADGDGSPAGEDCDDSDASVYPGADEVCGDGVVNDCDGTEDEAALACEGVATPAVARASWCIPPDIHDDVRAAGVGDVNGDGFDDLAFGWPSMTAGEMRGTWSLGGVFLFLGPVSGVKVQGDEDGFFGGVADQDGVGWDLVGLGDIDGDGYDDIAVGAAEDDDPPPTGTPAVYRVDGPADLEFIDEATVLVSASESMDCLGSSLLTVPDQDGDGAPDLLVGGRCAGEAHLLSGAAEEQVAGDDDIATFTGPSGDSRFGHAMASGDLDGDGVLDVAIAAPESETGASGLGFVSVFVGPLGATYPSADAEFTIQAEATDTDESAILLGSGMSVGDLDGDGTDDLAIGGPFLSESGELVAEGSCVVYLGPLTADVGLTDAHLRVLGDADLQRLGGELDTSRDLDGDDQNDLLLGNGLVEVDGDGGSVSGSVALQAWLYVAPVGTGTVTASDADLTWQGDYSQFGVQARVAGDTDGDGIPEVLIGNASDDIHLFDLTAGGF